MQVDMSILRDRQQPGASPFRKGRRSNMHASPFSYQSDYSPESKSFGSRYSSAYAMPAPKMPKLITPLAEDDDSPWRRTSEACGGHYRRPDLIASYSASSLGMGAGVASSAVSSTSSRPPLNDVLGAVDPMNERRLARGSLQPTPHEMPAGQQKQQKQQKQQQGEREQAPSSRRRLQMGEIQEMHEQPPAKPEPRRRARAASHELPERSGDGGDGGDGGKGRGNRGGAAQQPPPRHRPTHQAPPGPMGIRDFAREEATRATYLGGSGIGRRHAVENFQGAEDNGGMANDGNEGVEVQVSGPRGHVEQRRRRAMEERRERDQQKLLPYPSTEAGASEEDDMRTIAQLSYVQRDPLRPPPPLQLSPSGKQHASALGRQRQQEQQEHELLHEKFHRERERRRQIAAQEEAKERVGVMMRTQQARVRDDPNAFDQGLVHLYRQRHTGSETAALMTNMA